MKLDDCIFCKIGSGEVNHWKVLERENSLAFLDVNPMTAYHTLVIPKDHYADVFSAPADVLADTMETLRQVCLLYERKLGIHNVQIFNNSGKNTMQSVFHLHFHIFPKTEQDDRRLKFEFHPELVSQYADMLARLRD